MSNPAPRPMQSEFIYRRYRVYSTITPLHSYTDSPYCAEGLEADLPPFHAFKSLDILLSAIDASLGDKYLEATVLDWKALYEAKYNETNPPAPKVFPGTLGNFKHEGREFWLYAEIWQATLKLSIHYNESAFFHFESVKLPGRFLYSDIQYSFDWSSERLTLTLKAAGSDLLLPPYILAYHLAPFIQFFDRYNFIDEIPG